MYAVAHHYLPNGACSHPEGAAYPNWPHDQAADQPHDGPRLRTTDGSESDQNHYRGAFQRRGN